MSTVACDLYRISFKKEKVRDVLLELELLGKFEPVEPLLKYDDPDINQEKKELSIEYATIKETISIMSSYKSKAEKNSLIDQKSIKSISNFKKDYKDLIRNIKDLKTELEEKQKKLSESEKKLQILTPLSDSEVMINEKGTLFNTKLLKMSPDALEKVKYDIEENDLLTLHSIKEVEKTHYALIAYNPVATNIVEEITSTKDVEYIEIKNQDHPVSLKEYFSIMKADKENSQKEIEKTKDKLAKIANENLANLRIYADLLKAQIQSLSALRYVGFSFDRNQAQNLKAEDIALTAMLQPYLKKAEILHIDGWIIPDDELALRESMNTIDKNIQVSKLDPEDMESRRSIIQNSRVFSPFEVVTSMMGTPNVAEIDPSPYVAPFFVAFFGFALGDAGYGTIISLASLYGLFGMKLPEANKKALWLMLYCGLSTIFFGAITGGWFGADLTATGEVGRFLAQFKVFDISTNIMLVLIGSLVTGFIHQIFGLTLSMWSFIKNGMTQKAFWMPGTWILLLVTIAGYGLRDMIGLSTMPWSYILAAILFIFAWGQGYGTKNLILRPLKGIMGIFNITSFLSNTLSYARLLALALATGVIASVVNWLAAILSGNIPVVSTIIMILILVFGHAFNLLLNLVGTFINVVRLHLVEFFPHFFEARGIELKPLRTDGDYSKFDAKIHALDLKSINS